MRNKWVKQISSQNSLDYRGRFAPSPTGRLHLGSLYTAVASFLDARSRQGQWLLRIDDLDTARNRTGASDDILSTLEAFGLHWDDSVIYQRQHLPFYQESIEQLIQQNCLYRCICTRKQAAQRIRNPCPCKNRPRFFNQPHCLRIKINTSPPLFHDSLQGRITQIINSDWGDFIIRRKDEVIAYQLAVVVDDMRQNINHVVRGIDLLDSTPKQYYLQQQLGFHHPHYAHIPIVIDSNGHKLSKQTFAKTIETHQVEKQLFYILTLLKQQPPQELQHASVSEILTWGMIHWNIQSLKNCSFVKV